MFLVHRKFWFQLDFNSENDLSLENFLDPTSQKTLGQQIFSSKKILVQEDLRSEEKN